MLDRRTLLLAIAGAAAAPTLAGCGITAPGGAPTPLMRPSHELPAVVSAVLALAEKFEAALEASDGWKASQAQIEALEWCLGVLNEQRTSVGWRPTTPSAEASASPVVKTTPPLAKLTEAVTQTQALARDEALAELTADPLGWASLAAWLPLAATVLAKPGADREPATPRLQPAPGQPDEVVAAVVEASHQAAYGYQVAAGAPGLSQQLGDAARGRAAAWTKLATQLSAHLPSPTPAAPAYRLKRPGDAPQGRALAVQLERAALPIVGRAVAHGPVETRATLITALSASAEAVVAWGGAVPRRPGF